ncbi:MAG: bis(5'-nucleosyl)-tetraphosphatase (symmetrical) YqeK [Treponema sp.]|nr:bis(5'-nucleosyl)-tetraphosphatase (symmetrical) YqeK [Treponema sp.]
MEITKDLIDRVSAFARAAEKKERWEHSLRVAATAELMCNMFGVDPAKGYLAGVAHDMCKDLEDAELLALAAKDQQPISEVERQKPALLHGRAAAMKLESDFGVKDADIIQAVSRHTMGGASLCPLAKIIYAADKIEPGRPQSTQEYRDALFAKSLDALTLAVLEENMRYLESKGKKVADVSIRFRESLRRDITRDAQMAAGMAGGF